MSGERPFTAPERLAEVRLRSRSASKSRIYTRRLNLKMHQRLNERAAEARERGRCNRLKTEDLVEIRADFSAAAVGDKRLIAFLLSSPRRLDASYSPGQVGRDEADEHRTRRASPFKYRGAVRSSRTKHRGYLLSRARLPRGR